MKNLKFLFAGVVLLSTAACAQHSGPIDPVGAVMNYGQPHPSSSFNSCRIYTKTILVSGHTYVFNGLQCKDDKGNWVSIN